jgi:signal transduction histidine kinase
VFVVENAILLQYANRAAADMARLNRALAEASAAKSRFFAAANHDLRQPFQSMRLFYEVLAAGAEERQRKVVDGLGRAIDGAETLLNGLLDTARLESGAVVPRPQKTDLARLLAEVKAKLEPLARDRNLTMRLRVRPAVARIDPVLFERIVTNLVTNSIRYTRDGGILIALRPRAGTMVAEVWDTGIGIPEEHRRHIFEEFYQVANQARDRGQGLGLGLSIVKRLCDLLGCEVTFASRPGKGTVFRVAIADSA